MVFFLVGASKAFATIDPQLVVVQNASNWKRPVIQATNPNSGTVGGGQSGSLEIFGGIMGTIPAECSSMPSTCNNCGSNNIPCNANRITRDTELTIYFRTDNASAITPTSILMFLIDNKQVAAIDNPDKTTQTGIIVNAELKISIRWGDLCTNIGAGADCSTPVKNKSIQFGISTSNDNTLEESLAVEISVLGDPLADVNSPYRYVPLCSPGSTGDYSYKGFCWLTIARGDEKVYVENETYDPDFFNDSQPALQSKYSALRVYYAEGNADGMGVVSTTVNSGSPTYKDFTFTINNKTPTLDDNKITGLTNGSGYYFMFANVDEANNVFYFSDPTQLSEATGHTAIPQEVSGALEGKECFIATAAYGTPFAPQLDILRAFRDQYLKTNALGRWFVKEYYIYGPKWAQKIKRRDSARAVVRAALSPVVSAAQWVILYGLRSFILISFIGFILGFFIIRRVIRDHE